MERKTKRMHFQFRPSVRKLWKQFGQKHQITTYEGFKDVIFRSYCHDRLYILFQKGKCSNKLYITLYYITNATSRTYILLNTPKQSMDQNRTETCYCTLTFPTFFHFLLYYRFAPLLLDFFQYVNFLKAFQLF